MTTIKISRERQLRHRLVAALVIPFIPFLLLLLLIVGPFLAYAVPAVVQDLVHGHRLSSIMHDDSVSPVDKLHAVYQFDKDGGGVASAIDRSGRKDLWYSIDKEPIDSRLLDFGIKKDGYFIGLEDRSISISRKGDPDAVISLPLDSKGKPLRCEFHSPSGNSYDQAAINRMGLDCGQAESLAGPMLPEVIDVLTREWS